MPIVLRLTVRPRGVLRCSGVFAQIGVFGAPTQLFVEALRSTQCARLQRSAAALSDAVDTQCTRLARFDSQGFDLLVPYSPLAPRL